MTIQYAILGLLSWQSFSGYDLKKIISESDIFYWSGNNNQIYRSLVQLHEDGLVTQEVIYQESLPPRKVYSLTGQGRDELRRWVQSMPELPEFRHTFLIQLAWADQLSDQELMALLENYIQELELKLHMQQEKARRGQPAPDRTSREAYLWARITENLVLTYHTELDWAHSLRRGLAQKGGQDELPAGGEG